MVPCRRYAWFYFGKLFGTCPWFLDGSGKRSLELFSRIFGLLSAYVSKPVRPMEKSNDLDEAITAILGQEDTWSPKETK